ncbi:MAG TPA: sulfatase-like hydrolase/transferase [Planctomycetota bacterium]|nr:sulfatase-like hydrolase/transferase [Planctomycetota bacterium]
MPQKRPNVLWISFEDTNPFYGCYGDAKARTPNVDKLAKEGCRWPLTFAPSGVCAPTRAAIITGMYPISVGTHHMRTTHDFRNPHRPPPYSAVVPPHVKCFTEYLRAAGYYCTNNSKTDYQFTPPLTAWDELSDTAHWRNRPDPQQPFFAVFNLMRTHEATMWPENTPELTFDPKDMHVPPYFPDTPKVREALARMYTNIAYNDGILGKLLKELEEDGLAEDTIVMHWSDHGPLPRGKRWPYDSGVHVPMIVRWPGGLKAGSVSHDLLSTIDLGPTVLSLCGVEIPHHIQGRAFLGEQAHPPREYVYLSRDRHDESYDRVRAIRDKRFKFIRNYHPELPYALWLPYLNKHPIMQEMWRCYAAGELSGPQLLYFQERRPVEEFYDTQSDPWEINNLAGDPKYAQEISRLRTELDRWLKEVGDYGEITEFEMVRRWHPEGKPPKTSTPLFAPICDESPGTQPFNEGGTLRAPALLQIHCGTQGASIAYTTDTSASPRWKLYTSPLRLMKGTTTLRARAARIGYEDSDERVASFNVLD